MNDSKSMIKIKRMRSGDLVFEINPKFSLPKKQQLKILIKFIMSAVFRVFLPIFAFFDKLAERKKLVISAVGLGIGLGLSIITTQRPDALQAFPALAQQIKPGVEVESLKIPKLDLYARVRSDNLTNFMDNITTDELIHLKGSGYLGQNKPIVIADLSSKNLLKNMDDIKIGDKIIILGKNNGLYKYQVVETRETKSEYLPHVIANENKTLILYKSQNILRTRVFIVVAKPFK